MANAHLGGVTRRMLRVGTLGLLVLSLVLSACGRSAAPRTDFSADAELVRRLKEHPTDPEVLEAVSRALYERRLVAFYAEEVARAVAGPWRDPATPQAVREGIWVVLVQLAPTLNVTNPPLARELFVDVPLRLLREAPAARGLALEALRTATEMAPDLSAAVAAGAPLILEASLEAEHQEVAWAVLQEVPGTALAEHLTPEMVQRWTARVMQAAGSRVWELPEFLSRLPGPAGTEGLLELLVHYQSPPPGVPPEMAPYLSPEAIRRDVAMRLSERPLEPEHLRRLIAVWPSEQDEQLEHYIVEALVKNIDRLPPLPEALLSRLEERVRTGDRRAVEILRAAGASGAVHLLRAWQAIRAEGGITSWDLEEALRQTAPFMVEALQALHEQQPEDAFVAELVDLGMAARGELSSLERVPPKARLGLVRRLAENPQAYPQAKALLREALDDADASVQAVAWAALHGMKDPLASWEVLAEALRKPDPERERALEMVERLPGFLEDILVFPGRLAPEEAPPAPAVLDALLELAEDPESPPLLRVRALEAARRLVEIPVRMQSFSYTPDERAFGERVRAAGRKALDRLAFLEPRVQALLEDADPEVRRNAAYWFVALPGREPATAEALLEALDDPNQYVRHNAAMALAGVRAAPSGFLERLEARLRRGDPDTNVVDKLRAAWLNLLRHVPEGAPRLVEILLGREGSAADRRALKEGPPLEESVARAALAALEHEPLDRWLLPEQDVLKDPGELVRYEEDPPAWAVVPALIPAPLLDAWIWTRLEQGSDPLPVKLRMLTIIHEVPSERRAAFGQMLVEAVRANALEAHHLLELLPKVGYEGIRMLVDGFWDDPEALARAAELFAQARTQASVQVMVAGSAGGGVPEPGKEDITWMAERLRSIEPGRSDPRLGPFVEMAGIYDLGRSLELQRAAYEAGLVDLLRRHMRYPDECGAVQAALGALLSTMTWPPCE